VTDIGQRAFENTGGESLAVIMGNTAPGTLGTGIFDGVPAKTVTVGVQPPFPPLSPSSFVGYGTVPAAYTGGDTTPNETPFADVGGHWAYGDIEYVYKAGWMNGTSATKFSPDISTGRGMIVTVLWRIEGSPAPTAAAPFDDVEAGAYYAQAVAWAAEHGVVNGVGGGLFAPLRQVTREQVATILYRYAQYKKYDVSAQGDLSAFPDASSISGYEDARASVTWAVGAELLRGRASGALDPRGTATRAELAALLHRFHLIQTADEGE
jgi:hypothetical protein